MERYAWKRRIDALDAEQDCHEIYRILAAHEFPWDLNQSLGFALFRTYAVPSIGALLFRTGEFTERTQKRYEDTGLILDAVVEHGFDSEPGRVAVRRMNAMHAAYDISNDDLRYVLSTFVTMPIRWLDRFGWRRLTEHEKVASCHYYRAVGARMGIRDLPATWREFSSLLDDYEAAHFGFDAGGRAVADATLALLGTHPPNDKLPAALVRRMSYALMDEPLLDALHYRHPTGLERRAVEAGMRARAAVVRRSKPRTEPMYARSLPQIRGYPNGYDVAQLGTFPTRR